MFNLVAFFICLLDSVVGIILAVYQIVILSDIQFDFVSTKHGCEKLNKLVKSELLITSLPSLLVLLAGHWIVCLLLCPLPLYLFYRYFTLPRANIGIYDPAIIRSANTLINFQKESFAKIGAHMVVFFGSIYYFIIYFMS